jgi:hypothetical protein
MFIDVGTTSWTWGLCLPGADVDGRQQPSHTGKDDEWEEDQGFQKGRGDGTSLDESFRQFGRMYGSDHLRRRKTGTTQATSCYHRLHHW